MVIVTATDYVTVYPTTGFADHSSTPESTAIVSSIPTPISLSSASHSLMTSATAPLTPLPTSISSPQEQITSKPWSANLASAALAAIIIMALLLFSLIGHAIYQRYRGRCHNCTDNEKALAKWKSGDLKVITKAMVKERGSLNSIGGPVYEDLEKGAMACERPTARADALAALTRPESLVVKPKLWERAMGYMKGKNASEESAPVLPTSSSDRFFTVDPLPVTRPGSTVDTTWPTSPVHTFTSPERPPYPTSPVHIRDPSPVRAQPYTKHPVLDRAYSPPSPSMYSRATNGIRIVNRLSAQGVPAPHTYSEYMRNDGNTQPDVSTALNVRDKRRSRTYGGLPLPEGFVDVSLGEQR
jgi:hypothetical protein